MKNTYIITALTVVLIATSCKKEDPQPAPLPQFPEMEYTDLFEREIRPNIPAVLLDVNTDGKNDMAFTTLLVGDPIEEMDKLQFLILTNTGVNLPVNDKEQIPVLSKGDLIANENFNGYQWFELASIILVQKNTSAIQDPFWVGGWRNASNKYIPYQVLLNGKRHNGWVEISVNTAEDKIILHNTAISKVADAAVKAGY